MFSKQLIGDDELKVEAIDELILACYHEHDALSNNPHKPLGWKAMHRIHHAESCTTVGVKFCSSSLHLLSHLLAVTVRYALPENGPICRLATAFVVNDAVHSKLLRLYEYTKV